MILKYSITNSYETDKEQKNKQKVNAITQRSSHSIIILSISQGQDTNILYAKQKEMLNEK